MLFRSAAFVAVSLVPLPVSVKLNCPASSFGTTVLRMVAVSEPFYGIPIVVEGLMQGVGKTTAPFVYNVIGMWAIRITGTWICTRMLGLGLVAAWGCMIGHNLLLFVFFIYHYFSGRWDPFADRRAVRE